MPSDEVIAKEPYWTRPQKRALGRLRERAAESLEDQIDSIAVFWLSHRRSIKNVMHGFSLVPACILAEPPGAGVLSKQVDMRLKRPFAASLVSELEESTRTVFTTTYTLDLTSPAITAISEIAEVAAGLLARLADARRFVAKNGYGHAIGEEFVDLLDNTDRRVLAEKLKRDADA